MPQRGYGLGRLAPEVTAGASSDVMTDTSSQQESEQKLFIISPTQCRAGRAILDWSVERLSNEAEVGRSKIRSFEGGKDLRVVTEANLAALRGALERSGVVFVPGGVLHGPGVAPKA